MSLSNHIGTSSDKLLAQTILPREPEPFNRVKPDTGRHEARTRFPRGRRELSAHARSGHPAG